MYQIMRIKRIRSDQTPTGSVLKWQNETEGKEVLEITWIHDGVLKQS